MGTEPQPSRTPTRGPVQSPNQPPPQNQNFQPGPSKNFKNCRGRNSHGTLKEGRGGLKSDQIGPSPVIDAERLLLGDKRKSISGDWMSVHSQEQKFGCRELSKTTSSCRDLAVEANASAVGSKSGQLSVS